MAKRHKRINGQTPYDDILPVLVSAIKTHIERENDDFLLIIAGATGTGKSNLMLHIQELYCSAEASVDDVAMSRTDLAISLQRVSNKQIRFLAYDEANVNKRDSLTKFNKDLLDLYFSIRGMNIFHVWCNPSLDLIDKAFLNERLDAAIYIPEQKSNKKETDKLPRRYYYFKKKRLQKIFKKYENLKMETLNKCRRKYRNYSGEFREYDGKLKDSYIAKKQSRMEDKIGNFYSKYGINNKEFKGLKSGEACKLLGISHESLYQLCVKKVIVEGVDYEYGGLGHRLFKPEQIPIIKKRLLERSFRFKRVVEV